MLLLPSLIVTVAVVCLGLSSYISRILWAYRYIASPREAITARSTRTAADASASAAAAPASQYCHLDDLNLPGPIHLWSMIAASSPSMIEHFVKHYRKVGVPLEHMRFLVHFSNEHEKQTVITILEQNGVDSNKVSFTDHYHSDIKRDAINEHIGSLSSDAWLVYPDLDELFHFPCAVPNSFKSLCGTMVDRFATTKSGIPMPPVAAANEQSITQQYPKCRQTRGSNFFSNANGSKVLLFPVTTGTTGSVAKYQARFSHSHSLHYISYTNDVAFDLEAACEEDWGAIDHYSWSEEQIDLAYTKLLLYSNAAEKEKDKRLRKQNKKRAQVYKETLTMMNRNAAAQTWSLKEHWAKAIDSRKISCPKMAKKGQGKIRTKDKRHDGEPVHVVYSANDDSVNGVEASIRSIRAHSSGPVQFYFIGNIPLPTMPEVTFFDLSKVVKEYAIEDFMNRNVPRKDNRKDSINVYYSNYARFAIDRLLVNQTKVMYLDVDSLVFCDVYSLINGVLNDEDDPRAVAAVPRRTFSSKEDVKHVIRGLTDKGASEFPSGTKSFNAGIYIMHLDKWRRQNLTEKIRQLALRNREEGWYWLGSQPPLNIAVGDNFEDIEEDWNRSTESQTYAHSKNVLVESPKSNGICMLHFKGARKPWHGKATKTLMTLWKRYGATVKK